MAFALSGAAPATALVEESASTTPVAADHTRAVLDSGYAGLQHAGAATWQQVAPALQRSLQYVQYHDQAPPPVAPAPTPTVTPTADLRQMVQHVTADTRVNTVACYWDSCREAWQEWQDTSAARLTALADTVTRETDRLGAFFGRCQSAFATAAAMCGKMQASCNKLSQVIAEVRANTATK